MTRAAKPLEVYLEVGSKRTIASVVAWPGWARVAKDGDAAIAALVATAPRYAKLLHSAHIAFEPPADADGFKVVAESKGSGSTDFGVPEAAPEADERPIIPADLKELEALLKAYWKAFARTVKSAENKSLRLGPRGGGRDLAKIADHVLGAQASYLNALAWKFKRDEDAPVAEQIKETERAVLEGLRSAAEGNLPKRGPRGGKIWLPRYFVRRSGWHILDHIWEIEDRAE